MSVLVTDRQPKHRVRSFAGARAVLVSLLAMIPLASANAQVFSNNAAITIPGFGAATPYPSAITVAGRVEPINGVRVTLNGFAHSYPADVGALLVAPNGTRIMLMRDAGGNVPVTGVNLTFTSGNGDLIGAPVVTGTYLPTGGSATFAAPAPAGPYGDDLSVLDGASANGTWNLYIQDFANGDAGSINGGWSIDLLPSEPASPTGFTYQGRLTGGDASADFRVSLWDSPTATAPVRRLAGPLDITNVPLNDGLFTLNLDFGVPIPGDRGAFLQIEVNSAGSGLVTLSPRQRITPSPVAGTLTALTTLPAVAEIRGPQADFAAGSLTILATGTTQSNSSGALGGTLRLVGGNGNASAGSEPPVGTSLNNNVHIIAGDNTYAGIFGDVFNGNIQFFGGDGQPERMRIVGDNGFVGIGTTNPVQPLDVRGSIALGASGELRATSAAEDLRIIRGGVTAVGGVGTGTGFSVVRNSTGVYTVTYATPFTSQPIVTVTPLNSAPVYVFVSLMDNNTLVINVRNTFNVATDSAVTFIAIGPR
jgi:subtilisin-like proprotein convertase family protein